MREMCVYEMCVYKMCTNEMCMYEMCMYEMRMYEIYKTCLYETFSHRRRLLSRWVMYEMCMYEMRMYNCMYEHRSLETMPQKCRSFLNIFKTHKTNALKPTLICCNTTLISAATRADDERPCRRVANSV